MTTHDDAALPAAPRPDDTGRYFLTMAEAGRRLAVSRATTYELAWSGTLQTHRLGNRLLVSPEALERCVRLIIAGRAQRSTSAPRAADDARTAPRIAAAAPPSRIER